MDDPILVEASDEYKPVEVGSGWYLRGDIGYAFNHEFERIETVGDYDSRLGPFSGSVGIGYNFNDFIRADINLGVLPSAEYKKDDTMTRCVGYREDSTGDLVRTTDIPNIFGQVPFPNQDCLQRDTTNNHAFDLMANAYASLGTFSGFSPYVGGGIGIIYTNTESETGEQACIDDQNFQCSIDGTQYMGVKSSESAVNLQFALATGVSYNVSDTLALDLGYEYKFAPDAKYYSVEAGGALTERSGLDFHSVKLGLRYNLW